jgi:hypothetical protein
MARPVLFLGGLVVLAVTAVLAQDPGPTPISGATIDRAARCQAVLRAKPYLRGYQISCHAEGSRIVCEGEVPSRMHACAVYLACMSVAGVQQADISKLRFPEPRPRAQGTAATTVLAGQTKGEGAPDWRRLKIVALVLPAGDASGIQVIEGRPGGHDSIVLEDPELAGPTPFDAPTQELLPPAHEGTGNDPYYDDTYREPSKGDR